MKKLILYLLLVLLTENIVAQNTGNPYAFFVAGHTYGSPITPSHYGLHYPFADYIPNINNYPFIEFGVLTGDVVVHSTEAYWDSAIVDMNKLNMPVYVAAGNHDMGQEFIKKFERYYFSFKLHDDLFIVLTPGLNSWNIAGEQLDFLTETLDSNYQSVNNIFIFMHELIWWSPDNEYKNIIINFAPHYPGSTNWESVVKPLLLSYPNNFTVYAGDLGCTNSVTPFMYHHFDNITLIGSGMGGGVRDNIVVTEVNGNSVYYNLIAINGDDPKALGELTDFSLTGMPEPKFSGEVQIYPNPVSDFFYVKNNDSVDFEVSIYNSVGMLMKTTTVSTYSKRRIETQQFASGVYIVSGTGGASGFVRKLLVK